MLNNTEIKTWFTALGIIAIIAHIFNYLSVKGIIWIAHELFNVNWYGKFWAVYVALIVIGTVLRTCTQSKS